MVRWREKLAVGAVIGVVGLGLVGRPALGREVKLAIVPQKASAEVGKLLLLPPPESRQDGDAVPLYEKAVQALPDKAHDTQIVAWLKMPIGQLPADRVEEVLAAYVASFKCVAQAVKCRECNWPAWKRGTQVSHTDEYRRLGFALRLWARYEVANGEYDGALLALQTGFGMARQLGQAPTLMQLQLGVATAGSMSREIEQLVQREGAPNLYAALASLPKPFVDAEKAIEGEQKAASSSGWLGRLAAQKVMDPAHERTRALVKRLDSDLALLQCVEAIRSYAAAHGGRLPRSLAEITDLSIPQDPMCDAPFRYTRTGATAVLESTAPAGGPKSDEVRYEIAVQN